MMNRINNGLIGMLMIAAGGIVGWLGWEERQSIGSGLKRALTGSSSDKALWMLAVGAILVAVGLVVTARSRRR